MKRYMFQNQYESSNLLKVFFADVVCFLLVAIASVGFCYSYFSSQADASGSATMARVDIDYRQVAADAATSTTTIYGSVNNGTLGNITASTKVSPGDTINIKGHAVNTSEVDVYVLGRLEVVTNKDTEVIWFNIAESKPVYFYKGLFQVGASALAVDASQAININYTLDGEKYTSDYIIEDLTFTLHAHQKDHLSTAADYSNYSAVGDYSQDSIYATHYITNRKYSAYTEADRVLADLGMRDVTEIATLTLDYLQTDNTGAYLINNAIEWMVFKNNCNESNDYCAGMTFKLNAYLDAGGEYGALLDKTIHKFKGNFDGQGYTISNWYGWNGLFYVVDGGNISNVGMESFLIVDMLNEDIDISAIGSIAGGVVNGVVENCFGVDAVVVQDFSDLPGGCVSMYNGNQNVFMGALVGILSGDEGAAVMRNCYAASILYYGQSSSNNEIFMGGLVGAIAENAQIETSFFIGAIVSEYDKTYAGAIVGANVSEVLAEDSVYNHGSINNCVAMIVEGGEGVMIESVLYNSGNLVSGERCAVNNCLVYLGGASNACKVNDNEEIDSAGESVDDKIIAAPEFASDADFWNVSKLRDSLYWDTRTWFSPLDFVEGGPYFVMPRVFYNF